MLMYVIDLAVVRLTYIIRYQYLVMYYNIVYFLNLVILYCSDISRTGMEA